MKKRKRTEKRIKIKKNMERVALLLVLLFSLGLSYQLYMEEHFMVYRETLRFHVRAADDTAREQRLKLEVRDRILEKMRKTVEHASDARQLKELLQRQQGQLWQTATDVLRQAHSVEQGKVRFTRERFPLRFYGNVVFPAGEYQALCIDIGPALGHNWWCAIYPELCYNAKESFSLSEKGEQDMETVFSPEEKQTLRGEKIRFRFKLLEWLSSIGRE